MKDLACIFWINIQSTSWNSSEWRTFGARTNWKGLQVQLSLLEFLVLHVRKEIFKQIFKALKSENQFTFQLVYYVFNKINGTQNSKLSSHIQVCWTFWDYGFKFLKFDFTLDSPWRTSTKSWTKSTRKDFIKWLNFTRTSLHF